MGPIVRYIVCDKFVYALTFMDDWILFFYNRWKLLISPYNLHVLMFVPIAKCIPPITPTVMEELSFWLLTNEKAILSLGELTLPTMCWILLKIGGMCFGIIDIYTSNKTHDKGVLWQWYALSLPPTVWLMRGDFNMVEKTYEKFILIPNRCAIGEREAYFFMKNKLGLSNPNTCFKTNQFFDEL